MSFRQGKKDMLTRVRESMPPGLSSLLKIKPVGVTDGVLAMTNKKEKGKNEGDYQLPGIRGCGN
jgi:hypothetical protein